MIDPALILRRRPDIECTSLDDGAAVKFRDEIHVLNQTAVMILELCDGRRCVGEIAREMTVRFPEDGVGDAVQAFLGTLCDSGLVDEG